ncbi:MAG: exodeoxyribonuclease V subunit alpha [Actinomycetota bacterium]
MTSGQLSLFDPPPPAKPKLFLEGDALHCLLAAWVERGWLRPLDQAMAHLLRDLFPECLPLVLLGAALASHQLGRGHVCLDLQAALAAPDLTLSLPPENDSGDGECPPLPSEVLKGLTVQAWCEAFLAAPGIVCAKPACIAADEDSEHPGHPLVLVGQGGRPRLYLRRYWRHEQQVARALHRRLATEAAPPANLRQSLDALFPPITETPAPDWQKIACALAARGALTLITGGPGTGKTTTVIRLLALLQGNALALGRALRIRLAAPTGKAAARLTASIAGQIASLAVEEQVRQAIPAEVSTLHRLLGSRPGTRHFVHGRDNPLPLDVLVVDEASMIDLEMMSCLLEALPDRARLILLGDKDQLASVEAGAVLGDLCHEADFGHYTAETLTWIEAHAGHRLDDGALRPGDPIRHALAQQTVMLRHSRRFHADSGIGKLAKAINQGEAETCRDLLSSKLPDLAVLALKDDEDTALDHLAHHGHRDERAGYGRYLSVLKRSRPEAGPDSSPADPAWNDWAVRVLEAFGSFQLLTALRCGPWGVEGLNPRIARTLQKAGLVDGHEGWYEGRPVLVTRNDYGLGVMNGDIGIALRVPVLHGLGGAHTVRRELRVAFIHPDDSRKARFLHPSRLTAVETAFAMTVHKSQGSEFDHAALVLPDRLNPILTRELVYTAVTRAKKAFTLVESRPELLEQAVKQQVVRESGLIDLMWPTSGA